MLRFRWPDGSMIHPVAVYGARNRPGDYSVSRDGFPLGADEIRDGWA